MIPTDMAPPARSLECCQVHEVNYLLMDDFKQTLSCTTEIGAERPMHKCGNPMSKDSTRAGKQQWRCFRICCNEARVRYNKSKKRLASRRKYKLSDVGAEKNRQYSRAHQEKKRLDPEFRKRRAIYMMYYYARKKKEAYGNQGLTLRDDGEAYRPSRDRASA